MKNKETLEKVAESLMKDCYGYEKQKPYYNFGFLTGVKYQNNQNLITHEIEKDNDVFEKLNNIHQEVKRRMFDEKEVLDILNRSCEYIYKSSKIGTNLELMPNLLIGFFEQFKKN